MQPFTDSTDLLSVPQAMRDRLAEEGYLFLRQIMDAEVLLDLRRQITHVLQSAGWLADDSDPMAAVPGIVPYVEGEEGYLKVYNEVQKLQAFHCLAHNKALLGLMQSVVGESAFPHPLAIARLVFPDNDEWSTPAHQDYPNNQGSKDLYAAWIPLGDCPQSSGSLSVLQGSHRLGLLPLEYSLGAGHRRAKLPEAMAGLDWHGGDFKLGDLLIFHSHTVHRALHNKSSHMRLSVDYRYQREGEPLTEACLKPHFQRLNWEEIYAGWQDRSLSYYWKEKKFEIAAWDDSLHKISDEEESEGLRLAVANARNRNARRDS